MAKLVGRINIPLTLEQMPMYFRTETEGKYHNLFDASLFSEKGCTEAHLLTSLDRFLKNLFGTLQVKLLEILARLKESSDSQQLVTKLLEKYLVKSESRVEASMTLYFSREDSQVVSLHKYVEGTFSIFDRADQRGF